MAPLTVLSHVFAVLTSLTFVLAGQARLFSTFTPALHQAQAAKSATTNLSPRASQLVGYINLCVAAGLLWPITRGLAAVAGMGLLCWGMSLRVRAGLSLWMPATVMVCLVIAAL